MEKVDKAIEYYSKQSKKILEEVNSSDDLSVEDVIQLGEELSVLEYKLTALEVAKEN